MNVLLCGYNWAGCRALDLLLEAECNVFVCTHECPDHIPSLFEYSKTKNIPVTYSSVNDINMPFKADVLCSIYYRNIIKEHVLNSVGYKAMNLHPSLLPKYRGCSSLTWAMINEESEIGFTYHYIDNDCDTGKIIIQKKLPMHNFENLNNLYQRVMFSAIEDFNEAFNLVVNNFEGKDQVGKVTHYGRETPEKGEINKNWPDTKIKAFIRAMISPPMPYAKFNGKAIKNFDEYIKVKNEDSS